MKTRQELENDLRWVEQRLIGVAAELQNLERLKGDILRNLIQIDYENNLSKEQTDER